MRWTCQEGMLKLTDCGHRDGVGTVRSSKLTEVIPIPEEQLTTDRRTLRDLV